MKRRVEPLFRSINPFISQNRCFVAIITSPDEKQVGKKQVPANNQLTQMNHNSKRLTSEPGNTKQVLEGQQQRAAVHSSRKQIVLKTKQRPGRPRTFSEREERWIVRQARINSKTSAVKLSLKCKSRFRKAVNPETVRNVLKKHKYHGRVPRRKPYISKANRKARLAFAKMYVKQPTEF
ncbi:hypothetical protein AVEN_251451-1 [Araneus ventricosus]|uniref:Transposase Tc1-like domain-containing protein n=1 Tax=Araneus ventricosus TaxID=182803 RepID=A0A4Y2NBM4_ARAVE|nr:hypothetical protein AVEN_224975-1 [Araneus ventricosus]GBN36910.1 hypothetical protein AVEN_251451-1 [Araneus ventricosus]